MVYVRGVEMECVYLVMSTTYISLFIALELKTQNNNYHVNLLLGVAVARVQGEADHGYIVETFSLSMKTVTTLASTIEPFTSISRFENF